MNHNKILSHAVFSIFLKSQFCDTDIRILQISCATMSENESEQRTSLRKDFLNILPTFEGQSGNVTLCTQSISTQTKITGFDRDLLHMVVNNFTSPANEHFSSAILRLTDVDSVAVKAEK